MDLNIRIFKNKEFGAIRTMKDERGEPWFCAKDVCDALKYKNPEKALRVHVTLEDKGVNEMVTPGERNKPSSPTSRDSTPLSSLIE